MTPQPLRPDPSTPAARAARRLAAPLVALTAALALAVAASTPAAAADHHAGYYYPIPQTTETYTARTETLPGSDRKRRVLFVTEIMNQMWEAPYPPPFAIFAKGDDAEKLIITGLYDNGYNTLYRMRGLLAMLTARARATPVFRDLQVEDSYTFFELLKMLGFQQLTVTDGDRFAHQVTIR